MKTHTSNFKENIKKFTREIDAKITYTINNEEMELGGEELNSITPHYEGSILKSVMKQLDVDSNIEIPVGTEVNCRFGVKTGDGTNLYNYKDTSAVTSGIIVDEEGWITVEYNNTSGSSTKYMNYYTNNLNLQTSTEYLIVVEIKNVSGTGEFRAVSTASSSQIATSFYNFLSELQPNSIIKKIVTTKNSFQSSTQGLRTYVSFAAGDSGSITFRISVYKNLNTPTDYFQYQTYNIYEYLNFGNYIVYKSEKQEDMNSYELTCYDKMLYSMIEYNNETKLNITYPISIRNYINAICNKLGLIFKNANNTFANYNKQIQKELYLDTNGNSLGYTYRDILDELAQVTASTICINEETGNLEVRYINNTNDTINGDYLKNINVNFGKKYGPVNSIVLSRAAESDNVYLRDDGSVTQNGLCEIKIVDNQIMNFNDRADYLPDILYTLDGLQYYLNDFVSTGITYYNLCDKYNVEIDDTTYSCIMFNDEINITQGLEEKVYTEIFESAETDYTKADKTDRRINQTYLIVDKQNQTIESVVSNVTEQNNKISQITQTVDEINSKISDIADITTSAEDTDAQIELEEINESNPIQVKVHPIIDNIVYDYPKIRTIRFYNNTTEEVIYDYSLCEDLLYYDSENYDEFLLDYGDGTPETKTAQITKRCKLNPDGSVGLLETPEIHNCNYPEINLTDGNYTISLLGYNRGYIFARLMAKNIYTTQFYTKVETNSLINQTTNSINLSVDGKLSNYSTTTEVNASLSLKIDKNDNNQIVSMLNASANTITLNSNRLIINSTNFKLNSSGNITATGGTIGGFTIKSDRLYNGLNTDSPTSSSTNGIYINSSTSIIATKSSIGSIVHGPVYTTWTTYISGVNGYYSNADGTGFRCYNSSGTLKSSLENSGIKTECIYPIDSVGENYIIFTNGTNNDVFRPNSNGAISLGTSTNRWLNIYASNNIYSNNNIYASQGTVYANEIDASNGPVKAYNITSENGTIRETLSTKTINNSGAITTNKIENNYGTIYAMLKGSASITPSAPNTPTGVAVTFSKAFNGSPTVMATVSSAVPGTGILGVSTNSRSTTGFTCYLTRTDTTKTTVQWMAFY